MIKAIETRYKGYRFRSRTEARWAVFFDSLGLKWNYELEGYKLKCGYYLPDFYIDSYSVFAEIKGIEFSFEERHKCWELSTIGKPVLMLSGVPDYKTYPMFDMGKEIVNGIVIKRDVRSIKAVEVALSARFEHKR